MSLPRPPASRLDTGTMAAEQCSSVVFLSNGTIKLGIDLTKGAAVSHFSHVSREGVNLLNAYDHGRLVQVWR